MRWSGIKNGDLLRLAAQEFDVVVTLDHSIEHQQAIPDNLAMIVLRVINNKPESVLPLAEPILKALLEVQPARVVTIDGR
jgi:hypothetical protein